MKIFIFEIYVTVDMAAANVMQCSWHSVMTRKNVVDCVLDSSEILQEFSDKLLLKLAFKKKKEFFMQ